MSTPPVQRRRRWRRRIAVVLLLPLLAFGLFLSEAASTAWRTPEQGVTGAPASEAPAEVVRVVAYNIAKCWAYAGSNLAPVHAVRRCVREVAGLVRRERPDLVFLSEVVFECGPRPVNQVVELARATGMHAWVFGENYRWGVPGMRVRSGNAILSRGPLRGVETQDLPGPHSWFVPMNQRRLPWADATIGGRTWRVGSVRNDSFDLDNNLVQVRSILDRLGRREVLLAGDFNAPKGSPPMRAWQDSGRFSGELDGPFTFPAERPDRTIDFILAPRSWTLREHRVLPGGPSDHLAVSSTFELPLHVRRSPTR